MGWCKKGAMMSIPRPSPSTSFWPLSTTMQRRGCLDMAIWFLTGSLMKPLDLEVKTWISSKFIVKGSIETVLQWPNLWRRFVYFAVASYHFWEMVKRTEWDPEPARNGIGQVDFGHQFSWWYILWIVGVLFLLFFTGMPEDLLWLLIWNGRKFWPRNHFDSLTLETMLSSNPTWEWRPPQW